VIFGFIYCSSFEPFCNSLTHCFTYFRTLFREIQICFSLHAPVSFLFHLMWDGALHSIIWSRVSRWLHIIHKSLFWYLILHSVTAVGRRSLHTLVSNMSRCILCTANNGHFHHDIIYWLFLRSPRIVLYIFWFYVCSYQLFLVVACYADSVDKHKIYIIYIYIYIYLLQ